MVFHRTINISRVQKLKVLLPRGFEIIRMLEHTTVRLFLPHSVLILNLLFVSFGHQCLNTTDNNRCFEVMVSSSESFIELKVVSGTTVYIVNFSIDDRCKYSMA